jgi:hypothetical protein
LARWRGDRVAVGPLPYRAGRPRLLACDISGEVITAAWQGIGHDIYPRLVAAAVISATRVALEHWLRTESDLPFPPVLRNALERVAAGLPLPAERRS